MLRQSKVAKTRQVEWRFGEGVIKVRLKGAEGHLGWKAKARRRPNETWKIVVEMHEVLEKRRYPEVASEMQLVFEDVTCRK